jgi:integrase
LVFTTTMGSPITRYIGEKEVNKIVKTINLQEAFDSVREGREPVEFEHAYPYAIRHLFCTHCFECGMKPKVVQALMGHARYSTTIDIYTHVMGVTFEEADKFAAPVVDCATEFPDLTKIKSA